MAFGLTERRFIKKATRKIYTVVWIEGENVFLERGDSVTFLDFFIQSLSGSSEECSG